MRTGRIPGGGAPRSKDSQPEEFQAAVFDGLKDDISINNSCN